jgi:hypothetical protein
MSSMALSIESSMFRNFGKVNIKQESKQPVWDMEKLRGNARGPHQSIIIG